MHAKLLVCSSSAPCVIYYAVHFLIYVQTMNR